MTDFAGRRPSSRIVGLLFGAWNDVDRVIDGLSAGQLESYSGDGSSFAWTVGHVTNQVDAWVNVRFAGSAPHPILGQEQFRNGGTGSVSSWRSVQVAVTEVQATARRYLEPLDDNQLNHVVPYDGSMPFLRDRGLNLQHALLRISAHHFFHIGEIATKRDRLGHSVGDYPGSLIDSI